MQFDLLYKELGEYGCMQRWVVWVASSESIWSGLLLLTSFFVLVMPDHRCAIPGWENDTYAIQNDHHLAAINSTIPAAGADDDFPYDQCHYYKVDGSGNTTLVECTTWVYDQSIFQTSLAADLNMVCGGAIMKSNAQMVNFAGIFVGSFVTGIISDKIGRKRTMCVSLSLIFFCSLAMAWSPNYIVFVALTFMVGFLNVGFWMPSFVICMEFVGPSHRRFAGFLGSFMATFGFILLSALAYGIRDWSMLLIVASGFGVIYFPLWLKRLFPESVRWLSNRGKKKEAKEVMQIWGNWNNVKLSESFYEQVMINEDTQLEVQGNIWDMFSSKVLAIRTTIIFLIWLFVCLGYYGLSFNAGDLGTDLYLNFMLQSVIELPGIGLCVLLLDRIGRKPVMAGSMLIGGVALAGTILTLMYLPVRPVATTALALIGKMGVAAGFATVYVYSAELFPTVVRNAGLGASSSMARIGGMMAPYIADLDRLIGGPFGKALPQVVFAVITIAGGVAALFLPETLNQDLPDTIEEADIFGKPKCIPREHMCSEMKYIYDLLYKELGEYGRLQRWVVWSSATTSIWAGFLILTSFFTLVIPNHRCAIPGWDNDTYVIQNDHHLAAINSTIPAAGADDDFPYDQCHYYKVVDKLGNTTKEECSTWVYDRSIFHSSIAADFNMVCGNAIMKSNAQMVNFAGIFVGSIVTGIFSDKFGRKRTMCTSLSLLFFSSLAMAWSPNYIVFVVLTFVVGFMNVGQWMPSFVIRMEFVGPTHRNFAGYVAGFLAAFGHIALAGLAYGIRDWSTLLIVASSFGAVYFPLWLKRLFPESPRWLSSRGRNEEAKEVIQMWGKWNKVELSESFFEKVLAEDEEQQEVIKGNVWDLFSTKTLAIRTILIFIVWFCVCLGYYGMAFSAGNLGSDLYLNFMLQALVELPGTALCILLLDRIGRKSVLAGSMLIGGAALVGTIFTLMYLPDKPVATTVLAAIGKMGLSAGFATVYIYSAELFPTVVRNAGLGASSSMARIGGMMAPYVADMDRLVGGPFGKALPQLVFAVLTVAGGLAALLLPETLHKTLPETIEDAKGFGKNIPRKDIKQKQLYTNSDVTKM